LTAFEPNDRVAALIEQHAPISKVLHAIAKSGNVERAERHVSGRIAESGSAERRRTRLTGESAGRTPKLSVSNEQN
jgi:hypothetical protein